jgi:small subunit ribosomal protein S17
MAAVRQATFVGTPVHIASRCQVAPRISTLAHASKVIEGKVVSAKMNKTVTVEVARYKTMPRYGKRVLRTKKYHAHDEENQCEVGDFVRLRKIPPLSKSKTTAVDEVLRKAVVL